MANVSLAHAANLVDGSLGTASYTASVGANHIRLMTANGSGTANGTELSTSGSYTAVTGITPAAFSAASTSTGGTSNTGILSQTNMPAATITGIEIWDSAGTPIRHWYGALAASKTTASGDTLSFAIGAITVAIT
jgi:hypothetical protein